eukprot:753636-Hanusia_phi.AAC.2
MGRVGREKGRGDKNRRTRRVGRSRSRSRSKSRSRSRSRSRRSRSATGVVEVPEVWEVVCVVLDDGVVGVAVGEVGVGPENRNPRVRLLLGVVHADHAGGSAGRPDAEAGDEGGGEGVGPVLAVEVGEGGEEQGVVAVEPPAHEHLQRVARAVSERPPSYPGRDV